MNIALRSYYEHFVEQLQRVYPAEEAAAIANIVFEEMLMLKKHHIYILQKELDENEVMQLDRILDRLLKHEPVQYVLGIADFFGLRFRVNKQVLIPRRETEELVGLVIEDVRDLPSRPVRILDIGTGSGCIAVTLKKNLPFATVSGMDISGEALEMARENARLNKVDIDYFLFDILSQDDSFAWPRFDRIVSNPPYITFPEKTLMRKNVLEYEPHQALFADTNDPLVFYRAITRFARHHLSAGGRLYVEINEAYGKETRDLFCLEGFQDAVILQDMQGKDRFVRAGT
jgi:release factor glutamine methyltransferase